MVYFDPGGGILFTPNHDDEDEFGLEEHDCANHDVPYSQSMLNIESIFDLFESQIASSEPEFKERCIVISKLMQVNPRITINSIKRRTGYTHDVIKAAIAFLLEHRCIRRGGGFFNKHWEIDFSEIRSIFAHQG